MIYSDGRSIFFITSENECVEIAKLKIKGGSVTDSIEEYILGIIISYKESPLHIASEKGWIEIAKCLIEAGAIVDTEDQYIKFL